MKKNKILFHFAKDRNGGEFRRIKRVNNDYDLINNCNTIEVVILSVVDCLKLFSLHENKIGIKLLLFPILLPFSKYKIIRMINECLISLISLFVRSIYKHEIVWGETHLSWLALNNSNKKIIIDIHGASSEEILYAYGNKSMALEYDVIEREILLKSDQIILQSQAMKKMLFQKHQLPIENSIIYKCGVDTTKFSFDQSGTRDIRQELNIDMDDIVFVYVGGLHKWQLIYETLDIFKSVLMMNSNFKFKYLIISQDDPSDLKDYCLNNSIDNVLFLHNIPHEEINCYLSISNIAWLLRENIVLNQVASPTKLGEYLSCGVAVITTTVASYWINDPCYGILKLKNHLNVDVNNDILGFINDNYPFDRNKIRHIALNQLSTDIDKMMLSSLS